jgi:glycosyltransferase involved in cell wall biosynthesis
MITRKVDKNEHLAGFIYNWVKKISGQVEKLIVISWQEGDSSDLPENVKVIHLKTKQNKLLKLINFKIAIWRSLKEVDGVFCHQMPIYAIVAGPLAKIRGKKVISWYTHSQIDWKLKLMVLLSDKILSASKESFKLATKKLVITGHGIDTEIFKATDKHRSNIFNLISVGRISPTKDYESMIKAVFILKKKGINNIRLSIIGDPGLLEHYAYLDSLRSMVKSMELESGVSFLGSRPNAEITNYLQQADLFINMSGTGSVDKAVLEAMACKCLVLTSNSAFNEILPEGLLTQKDNPAQLAEKIESIIKLSDEEKDKIREKLVYEIKENHNLDSLVKKIVNQFS